jgi:hypothetical protein
LGEVCPKAAFRHTSISAARRYTNVTNLITAIRATSARVNSKGNRGVAIAGQTRPRSVLTVPSGKPRDRCRQQVWLDRLRDVNLVAHRERPPLIFGGPVAKNILATFHSSDELAVTATPCMVSEFLQQIQQSSCPKR